MVDCHQVDKDRKMDEDDGPARYPLLVWQKWESQEKERSRILAAATLTRFLREGGYMRH